MNDLKIIGANKEEEAIINAVIHHFPFSQEKYSELEKLRIIVLESEEKFKPYIRTWNENLAVIDEKPYPGGIFVHQQNILIFRRPLDEHLIAHEYSHAVDRALGYLSDTSPFLDLYRAGGTAISRDAYFATTEWFAENLAAQVGWTQNGHTGDAARAYLQEIEPSASLVFEKLIKDQQLTITQGR